MAKRCPYIKGRQKEYQAKKHLEKLGYTVFRTAGSHGIFDLIAVKGGRIRFIQIEVLDTGFKKKTLEEIESFQTKPELIVSKEMWAWRPYKTWEILKL